MFTVNFRACRQIKLPKTHRRDIDAKWQGLWDILEEGGMSYSYLGKRRTRRAEELRIDKRSVFTLALGWLKERNLRDGRMEKAMQLRRR